MLEQEGVTAGDRQVVYKWVQDICRLNLTMPTGETLLHLCVNDQTDWCLNFQSSTTQNHLKSVEIGEGKLSFHAMFRFPNEAGLRLLLTSGSRWLDVNAMDWQGSTPLHIACQGEASPTIVELLLRWGCHPDSVDARGRAPVSYTEDESIIQLLTSSSRVDQLRCLCARVITKDDLKRGLMELLPSELKKFVLLHDARRT